MLRNEQDSLQYSLRGLFQHTLNRIKVIDQKIQVELIQISNRDTKFQAIHGNQFSTMLDPRDQVLQHEFHRIFNLDSSTFKRNSEEFVHSKLYTNIVAFTKSFLVSAVSNVVSVGFNYLVNGKLQEKQVQCFAAKNIVLNIQSIFRQIVKAIQIKQNLKQNIKLEDFKADLIRQIELILINIFLNLQDHYPQAPATGGTQRMKSVINEVDRVDDQANDLIYNNNIKIKDFLKTQITKDQFGRDEQKILFDSEDHTDFIMKVINIAISQTQLCEGDKKERTVKEIFTQFVEQLIWTAYNKDSNENAKSQDKIQKQSQDQKISNKCKSFLQIFTPPQAQQKQKSLNNLLEQKITKLQQLKIGKKYEMGPKIPSFVKPFNKQEIKQKKFTAKHSSILRILTKWSQYLQDIFKNAEKHIKMRLYPFKNINNQLCIMSNAQNEDKIINQLRNQYNQVKLKTQIIKQQTIKVTSQLLYADYDSLASNVSRFSETRQFSSKINEVLTSNMVNYLSILIHHLLKAGENIYTNVNGRYRNDNINLIVFRISDLLRAKFQCNETTFISLLETIYMLDESQKIKNKFKLVRIQNKLEDPTNNFLIKFVFMGKVQCELNLSIQETKGKQTSYYIFNHFVNELTRGKFGPILECAKIISQLDPMINSCSNISYHQLQQKSNPIREVQDNYESQIKDQKLKYIICQSVQAERLTRVKKYNQLIQVQDRANNKISTVIFINAKEQIQLAVVLYNKRQIKYSLIKINSYFIQKIKDKNFDFSKIDLTDVSNQIRQQKVIDGLIIYKVKGNFQQIIENISQYIENKKITQSSIQLSIKLFLQYELQKSIIESIKFNTQILNCNEDQQKCESLMKIVRVLILNQGNLQEFQTLKYKKYKRIDLSRVRILRIKHSQIKAISQEINCFENLVELVLEGNKLSSLPKLKLHKITYLNLRNNQLPNVDLSALTNLTYLNLRNNKLTEIDVSANANLNQFYLSLNQLTHVDLSKLNKLTQFGIIDNKLTNIDLSSNKNITFLYLNGNKLTNIDLSALRDVTILDLKNNQLTNIDLSALHNLNFLYLNHNKLTNIDLSALGNLTHLYLNNNNLTNVDLSQVGNLTQLELANNQLENLVGLPSCLKLQKLCIQSNTPQLLIKQLPASIKILNADLTAIAEVDFKEKINLNKLTISKGEIQRQKLINLGQKVEVAFQKVQQ